jgi:hypothetical protein
MTPEPDQGCTVSALSLIAAPHTPEPVCDEIIRRAGNDAVVTHNGARAMTEHFQETGRSAEMSVESRWSPSRSGVAVAVIVVTIAAGTTTSYYRGRERE